MKNRVFTNLKFIKPDADGRKTFKRRLKYLQERDGSLRRGYYQEHGEWPTDVREKIGERESQPAKWIDKGMGGDYKTIMQRADELKCDRTLARTWVISPDPELMAFIPEEDKLPVLQRITEHTMERWYEENGWGVPEFSYVCHDKINAKDMQQLHTHIITPGTVEVDPFFDAGRVEQRIGKRQLSGLRDIAGHAMEQEMERVLGRDRTRTILEQRNERNHDRRREEIAKKPLDYSFATRRAETFHVMQMLKEMKDNKKRKKEGHKSQSTASVTQMRIWKKVAYDTLHHKATAAEASEREAYLAKLQEDNHQRMSEKQRRYVEAAGAESQRMEDISHKRWLEQQAMEKWGQARVEHIKRVDQALLKEMLPHEHEEWERQRRYDRERERSRW